MARSSRRRHTRWPRDWSSDVCSSDLGFPGRVLVPTDVTKQPIPLDMILATGWWLLLMRSGAALLLGFLAISLHNVSLSELALIFFGEIGRASCRERVLMWVVDGSFKQKTAYEMAT